MGFLHASRSCSLAGRLLIGGSHRCSCRYESVDKHLLLSLLTSRSLHLLALRLAAFLDLPSAPVLEHWAKTLVSSDTVGAGAGGEADAALVRRIRGKLGKGKGGVYESVAREAWKAGRRGLALNVSGPRTHPADETHDTDITTPTLAFCSCSSSRAEWSRASSSC